jgi:outer membrane protein TolC
MKDLRFLTTRILLALVVTVCFPYPADSTSPDPQPDDSRELTLPLAVDLALRNHPWLRAAQSGREIIDAQLEEAKGSRWPTLQFSETFTYSNNPVFVFGSLLEQGRFGPSNFEINNLNNPDPLNNFRTALNLRIPVFDQLESVTRIEQARIGQEQAEHHKEMVRQQLRLEVIRAYYGVIVAERKREVTEEAVKLAESDGKRIRDLFNTGLVVQSDLLSAEVQIADFRQQRIQAEGDLITAYAALSTVLGLPFSSALKVSGDLKEKIFPLAGQEEFLRLALLHRPDYARAAGGVRATEEKVRGAWGQYLPRVDIFSTYGISGKDLVSGSSDYAVGAGLTYNIFELGREGKLDQARAARSVAVAEQERLANQIRFEVTRSYQQVLSARERVKVAEGTVAQAQEVMRIVGDRYQAGLTTITEVLRAQTTLVRTRLNLLFSRYEYFVGYANLLMAAGRLTDVQPFSS